jgi:hypothetical protein
MNSNNIIPFNNINTDIYNNMNNIINNNIINNNIINNNINNLNNNVFLNFAPNYGKELSLLFVQENLIRDYDRLKKHYYYGFSGIDPNNPLVKQFHIVKYNDLNNGFFTVHIIHSLFYRVENNIRTVFWTHPLLDTYELNNLVNKKIYKLPIYIMKDMVYQDNHVSNDNKLAMIQRFYEIDQISENTMIKCGICYFNPINKVLICGHTICSLCVEHPSFDKCHICRTPITNRNIDVRPLFLG